MKKFIAISFLSLYLTTTTQLIQLLKIPILVEHFIEHKSESKSITFWEFLCMHYAEGDVNDADYDKDMKLPFKSHTVCFSSVFTPLTSEPLLNLTILNFEEIRTKTSNFNLSFVSSSHLSAIWQPPQFC